jgi:hypothetical protein
MWVVLFFFLAIGAIIWIFLREYRKKTVKWEAASKERFEQIFTEQAVRAATTAAPGARPAATPVAASLEPAMAPAAVTERFLGQAETLLYYLLRTGIPDHAVFAKVPLELVLAAPGAGSAGGPLQRLAQQRLDFVVCDRNMRVAAVINVHGPGASSAAGQPQSALDKLRSAGVRVIEIDMAHMPHRAAIRQIVLGDSASGSGAAAGG